MTLSIVNATVPSRIGPGYVLFWHTTVGPVPLDDIMQVGVRETSGVNFLELGIKLMNGATSGFVVMGTTNSLAIANGLDRYVAPGAGVQVELLQMHSNLATVETLISGSWTWDPTGGLYQLVQQGASPSSAMLSDILAAVRHTFPRTA